MMAKAKKCYFFWKKDGNSLVVQKKALPLHSLSGRNDSDSETQTILDNIPYRQSSTTCLCRLRSAKLTSKELYNNRQSFIYNDTILLIGNKDNPKPTTIRQKIPYGITLIIITTKSLILAQDER